jgi:DNA-binding response OmpR family regulator
LDRVPIVVMSAHADSEPLAEGLRSDEVSAYLVKPFGLDELMAVVERETA